MVMKLLKILVVAVSIFFTYLGQPILAQQSNEKVKIAYVGDQEIKSEAYAVLRTLREEGVQLVVLVGDFDYRDDPEAFVSMLNQELTQFNIPYIAAVGNHDLKKMVRLQPEDAGTAGSVPRSEMYWRIWSASSLYIQGSSYSHLRHRYVRQWPHDSNIYGGSPAAVDGRKRYGVESVCLA